MTNPDYTHIALVIDRSGSMIRIAHDMQGGIDSLLKEQAALPGKLLIDVVTFDSKVEYPYSNASAKEIDANDLIHPRGSTALYDAVGSTITALGQKLAKLSEKERPGNVLVVVVTDGQENSSREWKQADVKKAVETQTKDFSWDFIFLGANIDSAAVGGGIGFAAANTMNYDATGAGATQVTRSASAYVTQTRSGLKRDLHQGS